MRANCSPVRLPDGPAALNLTPPTRCPGCIGGCIPNLNKLPPSPHYFGNPVDGSRKPIGCYVVCLHLDMPGSSKILLCCLFTSGHARVFSKLVMLFVYIWTCPDLPKSCYVVCLHLDMPGSSQSLLCCLFTSGHARIFSNLVMLFVYIWTCPDLLKACYVVCLHTLVVSINTAA